VDLHLTAKGKIGVLTSYMENFYIRHEWPSKLTDTHISTTQQELCTDDY